MLVSEAACSALQCKHLRIEGLSMSRSNNKYYREITFKSPEPRLRFSSRHVPDVLNFGVFESKLSFGDMLRWVTSRDCAM